MSKEYMLVEEISTFRNRYLIPKDALAGPGYSEAEWLVNQGEVQELSQKHLGTQISDCRVITEEEALKIFDKDNDYLKGWEVGKKLDYMDAWRVDASYEDEDI